MNRWSYWYFSFKAEHKDGEWCTTDSTVVAGKGDLFPIQNVYENAMDEFGPDVRITILTAFQIPEADYGYMANLVDGDGEDDESETDL